MKDRRHQIAFIWGVESRLSVSHAVRLRHHWIRVQWTANWAFLDGVYQASYNGPEDWQVVQIKLDGWNRDTDGCTAEILDHDPTILGMLECWKMSFELARELTLREVRLIQRCAADLLRPSAPSPGVRCSPRLVLIAPRAWASPGLGWRRFLHNAKSSTELSRACTHAGSQPQQFWRYLKVRSDLAEASRWPQGAPPRNLPATSPLTPFPLALNGHLGCAPNPLGARL
jgi:hypothetical protein